MRAYYFIISEGYIYRIYRNNQPTLAYIAYTMQATFPPPTFDL